jgi:hypothetical protein
LVAQKHVKEKKHIELGRILSIEEKIVKGIQYIILYESPKGHIEVTAFVHPVTSKIEITDVQDK